MDKSQFNLRQLAVFIDDVIDEVSGETVLTLISRGEVGVSGHLMLKVDADLALGTWFFKTTWDWQVNEPNARNVLFGSEDSLVDAAKKLKQAMADMVEIVQQRGGS